MKLILLLIGGTQVLSIFAFLTLGDLWAALTGKYPLENDLWGYEDT